MSSTGQTIETLRRQLLEAHETLRAIREGEVDAFVLQSQGAYRVEALEGSDSPYRALVEAMREGALTLTGSGKVLYCNRPFADGAGLAAGAIVGAQVEHWLEVEHGLPALLDQAVRGEARADARFRTASGELPVSASAFALPGEGDLVFCLLLSDQSDRVLADKLRIEQAVIARQRAELQAIIGGLPFALLLAERPDAFSYVNPTAEVLVARHHALSTAAGSVAASILAGALVEADELSIPSVGGGQSTFRVQGTPLEVDGSPRRALVVIDDVTGARLALQARERQEQLRETFVGILGHDLRNPLNTIMAASGALRVTEKAADVARATGMIDRAVARMARLIDDMLDLTLSRIGGGIPIRRAATTLDEVVRTAIDEIASSRPQSRIELEVVGDVAGAWDGARLMQVGANLLTNAVDYGAEHEPVRVRVDGSDPARVVLSVTNLGDPIPAELLPNVFDPFRQGRRGEATNSHVGLGLYIADRIVAAHGGSISVTSSAAQGTTFVVTLPRA